MTEDVERGPGQPRGGFDGVLLGFDAAWDNPRPLRIAADEAAARQGRLVVLTVSRPDQHHELSPQPGDSGWPARWSPLPEPELNRSQRAAARAARVRHPGLPISTVHLNEDDVARGEPLFADAARLVLGRTGRDGSLFGGDSTGWLLMRAVTCPTLIVPAHRPELRPAVPVRDAEIGEWGPVLAAVPDGERGVEVIRVAEEERQRRGCELHLLHAFDLMPGEKRSHALHRAADEMTTLTEEAGLGAGSPWCVILTRQPPEEAVLERAGQAGLVILGGASARADDPGRAGLARELLDRYTCPVMLLPTRRRSSSEASRRGRDPAQACARMMKKAGRKPAGAY